VNFPIQPIGDRIIVQIESTRATTAAGLEVPEQRDDYLVLACGPGKLRADGSRAPMYIAPGSRVVFDAWRCQKFTWRERQLAVVGQDDLIGVVQHDGRMFVLGNLLVCEQLPSERKVGLILLPSIADDRDEAVILQLGLRIYLDDSPKFEIGERVLYHKRMGRHFRFNGRELVAFEPRFVFCVVDDVDIYTRELQEG
jgi:chaperonin GroES